MGELVAPGGYYAIASPPQRKSFYAAGRFWVFYSDGIKIVYRTSSDGKIWTAAITIREDIFPLNGYVFSIWLEERGEEIFLHYAYCRGYHNSPLFYRRGIPNSDGTITWNPAGEQTAIAGVADHKYVRPTISVDSDGYVWIGYGGVFPLDGYWYPTVIMSGNNDGTWGVTPGGFPYQLSTVYTGVFTPVVPLTGGEMLAVYSEWSEGQVRARLWNGAWGNEISTNNICNLEDSFSAVAEGNDVHIVFLSDGKHVYTKYVYSTNSFSTETILLQNIPRSSVPVISRASNNDLYVFWLGYPMADSVYYRKYDAEKAAWENGVKWKDESAGSLRYTTRKLTCFYKQNSGYTGLAYTTEPSPGSYAVKFNYVAPPPPPGVEPEPEEPGSPGAPEPTPEPEVVSNTLTASGSRHTTPEQGSVGTFLRIKRGRLVRHITWVPVVITRA